MRIPKPVLSVGYAEKASQSAAYPNPSHSPTQGLSRKYFPMHWPTFFPEDCPPVSAKDLEAAEVYRLADKNPPSDGDFIPHRIKFPQKEFADECKACGLSIFTKIEDIIKLQKRTPALRNKFIASGNLLPNMGKIMHTPKGGNSHHTWWIPDNIQVVEIFNVITIN